MNCLGDTDVVSASFMKAEIFVGPESGVEVARKVIKIYKQLRKVAALFSDTGNILLADFCEFRPGKDVNCQGGVV